MAETAVGSIQIKCPSCSFVNERPNRGPLHPFTCSKCNKILIIPGRIGDIQVTELLGTGGMGAVYKGTDTMLQRQIAVKLMKRSADGKAQQTAEQYIQEARSQAKVNHPNVAQVFSAGWHADQPYIVMEMIDGGMLSQLYSPEKPMDELTAIEYGIQIARGLEAAYNAGITHRDIKPSNVLLDKTGQAKIVDFGLAGSVDGDDTIGVGTAAYIAPENLRKASAGKPRPDHRADMYSLGVTLYELVTGQQPFKGKDIKEKIEARFKGPPKNICLLNGELHLETAALINRLLKNDPNQRYATYADLIKDMQEVKAAVAAGPANIDIFSIPPEEGGSASAVPDDIAGATIDTISASRRAKSSMVPKLALDPKVIIGIAVAAVLLLVIGGVVFAVLKMSPTPNSGTTATGPTINTAPVIVAPPPEPEPVAPTVAPTVVAPEVKPPEPAATVEVKPVPTPEVKPPEPVKPPAPAATVEVKPAPAPEVKPPVVVEATPAPVVKPVPAKPVQTVFPIIQKGKIIDAAALGKTADNWAPAGGGLANQTTAALTATKIPAGDVKITATIVLPKITPKTGAMINIGGQGRLGFVTRLNPPRIYVTGRFGRSGDPKNTDQSALGGTFEFIEANKPFTLEIIRREKYIDVGIEGKRRLFRSGYPEGPFGVLQFIPGADGMRVVDLTYEVIPQE